MGTNREEKDFTHLRGIGRVRREVTLGLRFSRWLIVPRGETLKFSFLVSSLTPF